MNQPRMRLEPPKRRIAAILAACLLALSPHCSPGALLPDPVRLPELADRSGRSRTSRVAVVLAGREPEVSTGGYARGRGKGAAVGAGRAVGSYLGAAASDAPCAEGFICALYFATVLVFTPLVAAGGAIAGAAGSVRKKDVVRMEAYLEDTTSDSRLLQTVRETMTGYLPAGTNVVAAADGRNADRVLELGPIEITGRGAGGNTPVFWEVVTHARLVRVTDEALLQSGRYAYRSCGRKLGQWVGNDMALLRAELQRATGSLGERIADEFFLLDPIGPRDAPAPDAETRKRRKPRTDDAPRRYLGLRPVEPSTLGAAYVRRRNGVPRLEFSRVDSTRPTLRWEPFQPSDTDAVRVTNVRYEIRLSRSERGLPADVIERREDLRRPQYTIEQTLAPGAAYFWTVRARYEADGVPRVTEWGAIHSRSRNAARVPGLYSYRFAVHRGARPSRNISKQTAASRDAGDIAATRP